VGADIEGIYEAFPHGEGSTKSMCVLNFQLAKFRRSILKIFAWNSLPGV